MVRVPRISAFYGIVIVIYYDDHPPPHFHARYAGWDAAFMISSGERLGRPFPDRASRLVRDWAAIHRDELALNWARAQRHLLLVSINPLP
jgi:hypothetical protein